MSSLVNRITEFQKILKSEIRDEFGDISYEELAEKVTQCCEFLDIEKDLNEIFLSSNLKQVDNTFKRIETGHIRTEHSELRKSLKELLRRF